MRVELRGAQRLRASSRTHRILWYWLPVVLHAGAIFSVSSLPDPGTLMPSLLDEVSDKALHGVTYGLLGVLCYRALREAAGDWAARRALGLAIAAAIGYGITDELHQTLVPGRDADLRDLAADAVGACVATWIWHRLANRDVNRSS